jgi:hypothetical protein
LMQSFCNPMYLVSDSILIKLLNILEMKNDNPSLQPKAARWAAFG